MTIEETVDPTIASMSRRHLLKGAGATTVALGLAACTSDALTSGGDGSGGDGGDGDGTGGDGNGSGQGQGSGEGQGNGDGNGQGSGQGQGDGNGPSPEPDPALAADQLATVKENWHEPWYWQPKGTLPLSLYVVSQNQVPASTHLLSYGGHSPAPAIRMRGDETLYVNIHNMLAGDIGLSTVNENPDTGGGLPGPEGAMLANLITNKQQVYGDGLNQIPTTPVLDALLGEHVNGVHSAHVTNMHTHGLHVRPGRNENGTFSDDIFLRIVPAEDAETLAKPENQELFRHYQNSLDQREGSYAPFEFQLGNVMEGLIGSDGQPITGQPHPPGTHWYHPHSHGSTQNQVASGMAGFLVIEGDLEDHIGDALQTNGAAWDTKAGPWDYRERLFFVQRQFRAPANDPDAPPKSQSPDPVKAKQGQNRPVTTVNGSTGPARITMRPGAIERWRVLNGSVDGAGFMRLAVLEGHFIDATVGGAKNQLVSADTGNAVTVNDVQPISVDGANVNKMPIWQLAWDGVTLMQPDTSSANGWKYQVKDLSAVNGGQEPNYSGSLTDSLAVQTFARQPGNLPLCYNRPNEVAMADANRADIFFQAPTAGVGDGAIFTVVGMPTSLRGPAETTTKVLAHVVVRGDAVDNPSAFAFGTLLDGLNVAEYEIPVTDNELEITSTAERAAQGVTGTKYRSRTLHYAGWGAAGFPLVEPPADYVTKASQAGFQKLTFYNPPKADDVLELPVKGQSPAQVTNIRRLGGGELPAALLPPNTRTMSIDGEKFFPTDPDGPKMLLNTAEQWVIYNDSTELYSPTPPASDADIADYVANNPEIPYYEFDYVDGTVPEGALTSPQPWWGGHAVSYPMTLNQVNAVNTKRQGTKRAQLGKTTGAVDHPFHIHQNPFWLTQVDVPDADGNLVNVLDQPRWADVVGIPRNGGRAVFRSRFVDYEGEFVNHCHILLHEDNGMMQRIEIIGDPANANYVAADSLIAPDNSGTPINAVRSPADSWKQSLHFQDRNNSGQTFPGFGFDPEPPTPPTE